MGVHKRERELEDIKDQYIKKKSVILLVVLALLVGAFIGNAITMLYIGQNQQRADIESQPVQEGGVPHTADPVALASMENAAAADPTNADLWVKLGNFCFDHNLPARAVNAYERALELKPMLVDVWSDLGVMYRQTKQFEKAVDAFGHAASLDSKHVTSRFNMGIVYLHDLNDKASALKVWKELLALDPSAKTPTGQSLSVLVKELE
ncbi:MULTISPECIES: tetratricopeptide repeat protein [unclassified Pseudodesulfovibrio]|uniref:tetratricopeptide repeat protein n=1 Tax=unclassified Pseudodesulfovibrio TaxID=2661612 RepID=UPI000FEC0628|nr:MULTISPECIES: tetratricopeptide repeat protein [unclassified Pseudodesulfovibrio]MCJ2163780.1 tetratricopeptide repeat protein [Pseudodesulfovibrio sp. S3-i]RWU05971.1 hypothetical protein DWB63_04670 [Pseudodesulfovibrio sp. S3]